MILESIKTVLLEFKINKLRTFLTMLGIIVGIFSITIIFALTNSTKKYVSNTVSDMFKESIVFSVDCTNLDANLIEKDIEEYVDNNKKINKMTKYTSFTSEQLNRILQESSNNEYYFGTYLAIDENYFSLTFPNLKEKDLIQGRFLTKKDIVNEMPFILLREDVATSLFGTSHAVGRKINIDNHEFEVIGVIRNEDDIISIDTISSLYISYYYAKKYMDTTEINYIFNPSSNNYTKDVENEVKNILEESVTSDEYTYESTELDSLMQEYESMLNIVEMVFAGIAGLSIVVGGIGIMNIMLVSVSERVKETGIRMALGAKNSDIVFQFLIEGIMLTVLSGIFGIILAYLATIIVNIFISQSTNIGFVLQINFFIMLKIILFCGCLGIIFGIYPAIKAGKLDPVEALKYE